MPSVDYSLYLITDRALAAGKDVSQVVEAAITGGAAVVQYREKSLSTKAMIAQARKLQKITKRAGIPFIINDRIDIMLAVDADGAHVGQDDMPASTARRLIGKDKILGVSVKTVAEAKKAVQDGAGYLGVGDIFGTTSKKDAGVPTGLSVIKKIRQAVSIPIVGIGGITKENAGSVIDAGADGIAVISAIFGKPNPEREAKTLFKIIKERRKYGKKIS